MQELGDTALEAEQRQKVRLVHRIVLTTHKIYALELNFAY